MPRFRATVWFLHALAESNSEIERKVYEEEACDEQDFISTITDRVITFSNVDHMIWFGPVTKKD